MSENEHNENEEKDLIEEEPFVLDITEDLYAGTLQPEVVQYFVCMICYGIVNHPIKCNKCETLICNGCIKDT